MKPLKKQTITTWALNKSVRSYLAAPESLKDILEYFAIAKSKKLSVCPKGGGNSFGDVFMLQDHMVIDLCNLNRIIEFNSESGRLVVEGGALVRDVLRLTMPHFWYLSGISGSMNDTVGGVLSSNSTGKDSWKEGNFINNILSFKLLLADGSLIGVDKVQDHNLFNAVIGGLGMLGIVVEVTLQLKRTPSFMVETYSQKISNFHDLEKNYYGPENQKRDLFYAWVDAFPGGKSTGKSIIRSAKFVDLSYGVSIEEFQRSLISKSNIIMLKPEFFWQLLRLVWNTSLSRIINSSKHFAYSANTEKRKIITFPRYHYVTAHLPDFNLKYYPAGFMEMQALFDKSMAVNAFQELFLICRKYGCYPELCVVKRHIPDSGYLSFSGDGMSIAINFSVSKLSDKNLNRYIFELEESVLKHGGKIQLAKYPFLSKDTFKEMYPDYKKIVELKGIYDPNRFFWSDAFERLLS